MRTFSDSLLEIFKGELSGINLTRILDSDEFYQKQVLDSLIPAQKIKEFSDSIKNAQSIIDIGFGGGFPIIPLAHYFPNKMFIGLEARNKKVRAVGQIVKILKMNNVTLQHERVENVYFTKNTLLTFKAVGTVQKFLPMINCDKGIKIFFYKAKNFYDDEILEPLRDFKLICNEPVSIPGKEEIERYIIGYESIVPRGTKKMKKTL